MNATGASIAFDEGITVRVDFDSDGYPIVAVDTNGGFLGEHNWPAVEVNVNDKIVHPMFPEDEDAEDSKRWAG